MCIFRDIQVKYHNVSMFLFKSTLNKKGNWHINQQKFSFLTTVLAIYDACPPDKAVWRTIDPLTKTCKSAPSNQRRKRIFVPFSNSLCVLNITVTPCATPPPVPLRPESVLQAAWQGISGLRHSAPPEDWHSVRWADAAAYARAENWSLCR